MSNDNETIISQTQINSESGESKGSVDNEKILSQANEAALLNVLMYLNIEDVGVQNGWTMEMIMDELGTIYASPDGYEIYKSKHPNSASEEKYKERQRQYQILVNKCKTDEHFANLVIGNQSRLMTDPSYQKGGLNACTFTDVDGNVHVVYRGTGSGEWIDNGKGVSGLYTDTLQQIEAMEYFDRIMELNGYDKMDIIIEISGHSKGGNKAQYITINSKYRDCIDFCYSFDGQGMSPEAIMEFIERYGKDSFFEAVNKMYGFCSDNDFVNPLGIPIIPKDHRFYFKSVIDMFGIEENKKFHYADAYLNMDGTFSELTSQGYLSKFVEMLSLQISSLPPAIRAKVAYLFMDLMQKGEAVNGDSVSPIDFFLGLLIAIPIITNNLTTTSEGWDLLKALFGDLLETAAERCEGFRTLLMAMLMLDAGSKWLYELIMDGVSAVADNVKQLVLLAMDKFKNLCQIIVDKIEEFGRKIAEFAKDVGEALNKFADNVRNAWDKVEETITNIADKIFNAGKDFIDGIFGTGKDNPSRGIDKGKGNPSRGVDMGKSIGKGKMSASIDYDISNMSGKVIIGEVVDTGKGIANIVGETSKAIDDKVNEFKEKLLSVISGFFGSVANGVKKFMSLFEKDGAIRKAVVDTWNGVVDKAKQTVNSVLGTVKSQIKNGFENLKEGVSSIINKSKKAISQAVNKGSTSFKRVGKKVLKGMGAYMSGILCVDLIRLADLQKKLGNLERSFGEQTDRILKEASKATSEVRRQYSESYVQLQINSINQTCEQVKTRSRRLCDMLERKTNSLKDALSHYRDLEKMIIKDVIA